MTISVESFKKQLEKAYSQGRKDGDVKSLGVNDNIRKILGKAGMF